MRPPRTPITGAATKGFLPRTHASDETPARDKSLLLGPGEAGTPHVASFGAHLHALQRLTANKRDACPLLIRGDSPLAIETVTGHCNPHSARLIPLRDIAPRLTDDIGGATLQTVSQHDNADADRPSRHAYHDATANHPERDPAPRRHGTPTRLPKRL